MKLGWIPLCGCGLLLACGDDPGGGSTPALQPGAGLVLTSTWETGSLSVFEPGAPETMRTDLLVTDGDAALRVAGGRAVVLNRSDASNLLVLDADLAPVQIALPGCKPHDALALPDGDLLVTCYADTSMRRVDLATREVSEVVDLSSFADADGIPEMDQLVTSDGVIYATVQRLDGATFTATGNGLLVAIDPDTLAVLDADAATDGVQAYELPAHNPYTPLARLPDGSVVAGCAGNMADPAHMGLARVDPSTGDSELLVSGAELGGAPSELTACGAALYALVMAPDGWSLEEMRVLRVAAGEVEVVYTYESDLLPLAGLACDGDGRVYVGNRTTGEDAGLWVVDTADGSAAGPYPTGLPPVEIELF